MPAGRPSVYTEAFCQVAEDTLAKGYSLAVVAGNIGICVDTVIEWQKSRPEFSEAVKRGRAKGAVVWEDILMSTAREGGGNATAAIFGLKNRQPAEWRDKTEQEHSGSLTVTKIERKIVRPPDSNG